MTKKEIDIIYEKCKKVYSKGILNSKDARYYNKNYAHGLYDKSAKKN